MPGPGESFRQEGRHEVLSAQEREIFWNPGEHNLRQYTDFGALIDSATVDSGNTVTTELRAGLLLGVVTATGKLKQYDPDANDGTQVPRMILGHDMNMLDSQNTARDRRAAFVIRGGPVIASKIIGLDARARAFMNGRFWLDDDYLGNRNPYPLVVNKTTDYTILEAELRLGVIFTNRGAVANHINFTLPDPFVGGYCMIYAENSSPVGVRGATAGKIVGPNNAEIDEISFATEGLIVGSSMEFFGNSDGSKWLCRVNESNPTASVTVDSSSG